ncbi:DinB family protein [Mucilaginibacter limnophilus]|uniref:DinB family protein n=1 Tax=Mucilaginibacter limnophilus TaxID=1932778 RepID=A0A437MUC3_9SPHI|nr:DinB family protein [Mucilaginibacter limnophilus]RVU01261.1 DinB family protein [Mucilaginibacter limnophilus]
MEIIPMLLKEMDAEAVTTRKMLSIVPTDKFDWKPHPKSMSIRELAGHIAELPGWVTMALTTNGLDFAANPYQLPEVHNTEDILAEFEKSFASGRAHLEKATEADLLPDWTLRNGDTIYDVSSKAEVIRTAFCQMVHHRAQLGVFLRLLNIPIPGSYGPSADEMHLYDFESAFSQ